MRINHVVQQVSNKLEQEIIGPYFRPCALIVYGSVVVVCGSYFQFSKRNAPIIKRLN